MEIGWDLVLHSGLRHQLWQDDLDIEDEGRHDDQQQESEVHTYTCRSTYCECALDARLVKEPWQHGGGGA